MSASALRTRPITNEVTSTEEVSAQIISLFKKKKDEKLNKVSINRAMLQKPTWLPVLRPEDLELEEFLDNGIIKLKYKDKEAFEMFFNPVFGAPGKFEEKIFYILLAASQIQKKSGIPNYRTLYFSSLYGIAGLMGYDRKSASDQKLLNKIDEGIKKLATTGVYHKKVYAGTDRKGYPLYKEVFVPSMINARVINNVDSGRAHTIEIEIDKYYYETTLADHVKDLDISSLTDITSGPTLRLYEVLNSYDYTLESRGWWCVYLDNFLEAFGVKGKFEYESEKLRFIEEAFDKCKPALRYPLEEQIKDSIHFTHWQNKSKKSRKPQDRTLCFYASRWEPVINLNKEMLNMGTISDVDLPSKLSGLYG